MEEVIKFFRDLGFEVHEPNTSESHFYMNKWINDCKQIDAQGDSNRVHIRYIGDEPLAFADYNSSDRDQIEKKIQEWELGDY